MATTRSTSTGWLQDGGGVTRSTSTGWSQQEAAGGGSITGSGTPAAQAATVTGTAERAVTGSGTPAAQSVVVTGTGAVTASPTVASVAPVFGPSAGGTAVTITGTNFATGATVMFGGVEATSVVVVNSTTITCVTPAQA